MKKIYILSGLGADKRVFKFIDFTGYDIIFIEWILPENNETIENYAFRLTAQIKTEKPILIGLSFGGIMATEIAKHIKTEKIILIASAKTKKEIPFYYKIIGFFKLNKFLPTNVLKKPNFISNWFFGITTQNDKKLLAEILCDTNAIFLTWAIDKIINWKNTIQHENIKHIHGTSDRILPIKFVNADIKILKGGHFMTINKPKELTQTIKNELN